MIPDNSKEAVRTVLLAAACAWMPCDPAFAQQLGGGRSIEIPLIQMAAGLALCALVAFVAALVIRRATGGRPGLNFSKFRLMTAAADDRIRILESHRLSPHADICRFTSANREYLVIVSPGAAAVLRDSELPPVVPEAEAAS